MADNLTNPPEEELIDNEAILKPRPVRDDTEMDITPMIDITFLLLIFFIVCSTQSSSIGVALPEARFGQGISAKLSIVIKAKDQGPNKDCLVVLPNGEEIADGELQSVRIPECIEQEKLTGKTQVMILGAKTIKAKDLKRLSTAVGKVDGVELFLGVENIGK